MLLYVHLRCHIVNIFWNFLCFRDHPKSFWTKNDRIITTVFRFAYEFWPPQIGNVDKNFIPPVNCVLQMLLLHNHLQRHDIQSCCMFPGLEHMNKCKLEPNSTAGHRGCLAGFKKSRFWVFKLEILVRIICVKSITTYKMLRILVFVSSLLPLSQTL